MTKQSKKGVRMMESNKILEGAAIIQEEARRMEEQLKQKRQRDWDRQRDWNRRAAEVKKKLKARRRKPRTQEEHVENLIDFLETTRVESMKTFLRKESYKLGRSVS